MTAQKYKDKPFFVLAMNEKQFDKLYRLLGHHTKGFDDDMYAMFNKLGIHADRRNKALGEPGVNIADEPDRMIIHLGD